MKRLTKKSVGLDAYTRKSRLRGFTLIELMVTIAIAAVLLMLAAPSFVDFRRNSELTSTTNTLTASLNAARSEAMKYGAFAMIVPRDNSNWRTGWRVFVDKNLNQVFDDGVDELVLEQGDLANFLSITGNGSAAESPPYVIYNGSGYSRTKNGAFGALTFTIQRNDVPSAKADEQTRRLIVSRTGRVRSCRPKQDATCGASATD